MDIYYFEEMLIERLKNEYPLYEINVKDVLKNNGVVLRGLTVLFSDVNACPTVYLNEMFDDYKNGESIEQITQKIVDIIDDFKPEGPIDISFLDSFEGAKERLMYKLINREKNEELLRDIPHIDYLDLSIVFYVLVSASGLGNGTILVNNNLINDWGVSADMLYEIAERNTRTVLGAEIKTIEEVLFSLLSKKDDADLSEIINEMKMRRETDTISKMYVLSNRQRINGATCLLEEDMLNEFAEKIDGDFYIIPSSIHELILIPECFIDNPDVLMEMVEDVNGNELSMTDILSNNVYKFDRMASMVMML